MAVIRFEVLLPALRAGSLGEAGLLQFLNLPQWLSLATLWELRQRFALVRSAEPVSYRS